MSLSELSKALTDLTENKPARMVIHDVIYSIKSSIAPKSVVLLIRNPQTENLEIFSHYGVTKSVVDGYSRGVGTNAIGEVFYDRSLLTLTKDSPPDHYHDLVIDGDYDTAVAVRVTSSGRARGCFVGFFRDMPSDLQQIEELFEAAASICGIALEREELVKTISSLQRSESTTGLMTYHFFVEHLKDDLARQERYGNAICTAILDIANYREVVNIYGYQLAEELYAEVAKELVNLLRETDTVARFGTDEYIISLPNTALSDARKLFERFQDLVTKKQYTKERLSTSLTIGIAPFLKRDSAEDLLQRTQSALHRARISPDHCSVVEGDKTQELTAH